MTRKRNRTAWCATNRLETVDLEKTGFSVRIVGNGHRKSVHQATDFTSAITATLTMNTGRPFIDCCIRKLTVCSFVESCKFLLPVKDWAP